MTSPDWRAQLRAWWQELAEFPWRQMTGVLYRRFREARLGVSASSLTFTTVLALVPLFTVGLAVFSAFPVFGKFQDTIQRWLIDSLVPESISRQVLGYLTQFSRKASRLGSVGLVAVLFSAIALMVTIERTLGQIWRVEHQRPLQQRLILYWSAITLGPLLLGASLAITSYVATASRGVVDVLPGSLRWLLDSFEFVLLVLCVSGLYFYVPYARVRWRHALTAGLMTALGIELGKKLLTGYLAEMPTYSAIYGAFAAVPILLVWIYMAWVIVLLGAVVASSLPELGRHHLRRPSGAGWRFRLSLEVLSLLQAMRLQPARGLSQAALAKRMRVQPGELDAVLRTLVGLDWIGTLQEEGQSEPRMVLLVEPAQTPLAPLVESQLLRHAENSNAFWSAARLDQVLLADVLSEA
ncbi:YihY family inner membrane protein [Limnohabitans sp.]|uniref:YihY family inner membrane protein n=1 Tax=Limnohabitans sp. TaxID=1907725 RepID=UPI0035B26622